jgi:RNA polymerase sigma-70 factor (ECF subfamily)
VTPASTDLASAATRLMSGDATTDQPNVVRLPAKPFADIMSPLYSGLVRRLVLVLGNREDAEDVAQDAYERAYRSWSKFDGRDPRAWLYTIALRLAFNQLERRRNLGRIISRSTRREWTDAVDPDLLSALNSLQPRVRVCILLHSVDGFTVGEIADIFGEPIGTVSSRLSRAKAGLKAALEMR